MPRCFPSRDDTGIERRRIFRDNRDRDDLLNRLELLLPETHERRYDLVRRGYDLERVVTRVAEVLAIDPDQLLSKGRKKEAVAAGSLLCFWAVRELGLPLTGLARRLEMTVPAIGYAVTRGEQLAREIHYCLVKSVS